ncbi:YbhN family protein [Spirillospora sp. NPDC048911]|uniref:lysylphosphatidylglycerol synthase transmembrane domain-containing protein n=1 Tax=Spirillospora sp. NPDC048911 TaxID=3364527 RepID=UPI00371F3F5E
METIAAGAERAAPAGFSTSGGRAATPALRRPLRLALRRTYRSPYALTAILLAAATMVTVALKGTSPFVSVATAFRNVHWEFVPVLVTLSVLHYVLAAVTLRGAAGRRLPLYTTTLAQFTAAAANRVTPGGLGAVAVNTRYLVCRGVPLAHAAVAVAVMQVVGIPADLLLMGAVLGIDGGDGRVLGAMGAHASQVAGMVPPWPVLAGVGVVLPAALLWGRRAARSTAVERTLGGLTDLCRRPADLAVTVCASAATTFVMGLAFALSVLAVPGAAGPGDTVTLLAAYLVGAAAGAALPSPGGVGSTEAALVTALAALGIAAGPALQAVLLFRAITFWAPVPIGLLTCRTLRRDQAGGDRASGDQVTSCQLTSGQVSPAPAVPEGLGTQL